MSGAIKSLKANRAMRRHGKGIFGKETKGYAFHRSEETKELPKAPAQVRARFAEEAAEHDRKERAKWIWTFVLLLVLPPLLVYFVAIIFYGS